MTALATTLRNTVSTSQRPSWLGLLGVVGLVVVLLALLQPNFLVEFNLYTVTYNVSLAVIIAFAQMVVVATGWHEPLDRRHRRAVGHHRRRASCSPTACPCR